MANFNKVLLMGNLTRDPELRFAGGQGGTPICKFGLAVNRKWRSASGESQEETCFTDITVFGRQGETCNQYLSKGRPVFVEGRLQYSTWEDRETGARRSKLEVVAERVQFLGGRSDSGGGGGGNWNRGSQQGGGYQNQDRGGGQARSDHPARSDHQGGGDQSGRSNDSGGGDHRAPPPAASPPAQEGGPPSTGIDYDDIPF